MKVIGDVAFHERAGVAIETRYVGPELLKRAQRIADAATAKLSSDNFRTPAYKANQAGRFAYVNTTNAHGDNANKARDALVSSIDAGR